MPRRARPSWWVTIGSVESDSEPGVIHQIKRHRSTGLVGCDCMAYRFAKGEKRCKHTDAFAHPSAQAERADVAAVVVRPVAGTAKTETFTVVRRGISFDALRP